MSSHGKYRPFRRPLLGWSIAALVVAVAAAIQGEVKVVAFALVLAAIAAGLFLRLK